MRLNDGESVALAFSVHGGPVVTRDGDEFAIEDNGGVLGRGEIERWAELAGLDETDDTGEK